MEQSLTKLAGAVNNFYALAAFGIVAFVLVLLKMISHGLLSKLGIKDSYTYISRGITFLFILIIVALFLAFSTKDDQKGLASENANNHSASATSDDPSHISRDVPPSTSIPQLALTPTPRIDIPLASGTPIKSAPVQGNVKGNNSRAVHTRVAPTQPLFEPSISSSSEPEAQAEPFLRSVLQALHTLSDKGIRIERSLPSEVGTVTCISRFSAWRNECANILAQADGYFDRRGHPTDFAGFFERSSKEMIPSEMLKWPQEESFAQCRSGFQTAAQSLLNTIELEIKEKSGDPTIK